MSAIREAYELIKDEARWCQFDEALDETGASVYPATSDQAVRWCARGALAKCVTSNLPWVMGDLHAAAGRLFPRFEDSGAPLVEVNDRLGHDAVLQVFEKVLAERGELA